MPVWCLTAECPDGAGGPGPVDTLNLEAGLEPAAPVRLVCRHVPAPLNEECMEGNKKMNKTWNLKEMKVGVIIPLFIWL